MTNPFELLTLYAAEYYNKASSSSSSSASASSSTHKSIAYALGTTILVSFLYKTLLYKHNATPPIQRPYNFLYTISLPFQYLYYKLVLRNTPAAAEILFEDKYFKEYDEWVATTADEDPNNKERLENMYYATVREKINDFYGDVVMCYDHATLSFAYYARTANIPYKYLETISRKYMIETNAPRELHVDIRDEYKKAKERTQANPANSANSANSANPATASNEEDTTVGGVHMDVFVKLKTYNTASNLNLHTTTNDMKEKTHKFVGEHSNRNDTAASSSSTIPDKILRDKANRYSYRGKIDEFAQHHTTFLSERRKNTTTAQNEDTPTLTHSPVSYTDFKKQMKTRSAL
jgi:hypothetical protein